VADLGRVMWPASRRGALAARHAGGTPTRHAACLLPPAPQNVAKGIHESKVAEGFASCGNVLWTSSVSPGCLLVRFQGRDGAHRAVQQLDGQLWSGQKLCVTPYPSITAR
jgi:hypothetical protein